MGKIGRAFNLLKFILCPALRDWHRLHENYKNPQRVYNLARWLGEMERLSVLNSPLTEGRSVDDNNGVLDQGLGPHQLIVAGVVDNIDDPGLAGSGLGGPGEVASVEPDILQLKSRQ